MNVFLGRQPVLTAQRKTYGYELLYRHGDVSSAFFEDPDDATRSVVERAMLEWGLAHLVGAGTAFINVTGEFLSSGLFSVLPADHVVLELLETIEFDPETVDAVRRAAKFGYRIALDDLVSLGTVGLDDVLPMVDIIKVEVLTLEEAHLRDLVDRLRAVAPRVTLLAEKVESVEMYQLCRELGFDLFQGYFFARPEVLQRAARPTSTQGALLLMMAVQKPDITIDELADIAGGDPTLAYRLLTLVNSSSLGLGRVVESVRHAIVLLGIEHVRHLAILLTMSSNARTNPELITLAVTRAHMARGLAKNAQEGNSAFTMGLLSVIDVVFQTPMAELVADLPIADDLRDALLHRSGSLGMLLDVVIAYEQADTLTLEALRPGDGDTIREAFGESTVAATDLRNQLESLTAVR